MSQTYLAMRIVFISFLLQINIVCFSQVVIYMNKEGGIYTVPCKINGLNLRFIFDTGSDDVSISLTEAIFMVKNGYLSENEVYGTTYSRLANGDITENTQILLREIEIGGIKIYNIRASVVHNLSAPLLLGQSAIEKLGTIQLEGNKITILHKTGNYNSTNSNKKVSNNSESPSPTTAFAPELYSNYSPYSNVFISEVYTCAAIYDRPDMIKGKQIESACDDKVTFIGKVGEEYYYIRYNNIYGYLWKGMIKK